MTKYNGHPVAPLLEKLDEFIRKYYVNRLLRGLIYFVAGAAGSFLLASSLEYFGQFDTRVRTLLFYGFAAFSLFILIRFVAIPLLKLYRVGKVLNYREASVIVGSHFSEVGDKLLNTLQLGEQAMATHDSSLLQAAIQQRIDNLRPVPFIQAVNLKENLKYLKFAAIPLILLIGVLLLAPGFTNSSKRLVNYNTFYEKKAPFYFIPERGKWQSGQNEDVEFRVKLKGTVIPSEAFVFIDGNRFKMRVLAKNEFAYTLKNVQKNTDIQFWADGFYSEMYDLEVLPRPLLVKFKTWVDYPTYTGMKDEELSNAGDLSVPAGTRIRWRMESRNTDAIRVRVNEKAAEATKTEDNVFEFSRNFMASEVIRLFTRNKKSVFSDSMSFRVNAIPDAYPEITVAEESDSLSTKVIYLFGEVKDDYGFSRMMFHYRYVYSPDSVKMRLPMQSIPLRLGGNKLSQPYYFVWDLEKLGIKPEDKLEYYFEIWDNDGVQGAKSTRSGTRTFSAPSKSEIARQAEQKSSEIKKELNNASQQGKDLKKDLEELDKRMAEKKPLSWEDKKKVEETLKKQEDLLKDIEEAVEKNKERNQLNKEFRNEQNQSISEKEKALQEMLEEMLTEEQKELMEKIQEQLEKNDRDQLKKTLEQLKTNEKDLSKQLERMKELYKELELEQKVQETADKLKDLAKEQKELAKETEKKDPGKEADQQALQKKQEELSKKFEDIKKDMKQIEQKNQDLEKPKDLDLPDEKKDAVEKDMKESEKNLDQKQNKKAAQKQKEAAKKMEEMSQEMESMMMALQQKQEAEDYNMLRGILENLVQLSYNQEELIRELKPIRQYNPQFVEIAQRQKQLKDDARIIEDSLFALSKRVVQIKTFVNKEMTRVNENLTGSINDLDERFIPQALVHQQSAMTGMNNLAVMLSDVLKNMQEQMKSSMPSMGKSGSCKNPSESKPMNMQKMKEMQQQLGDQMKGMQQKMDQQGGKKPGSKEFAEMAAEQAAIRRKLEELRKQMDKEGKGRQLGDLKRTTDIMDDIEKDLVNKRLNGQTINRLKELEMRLLEHERAEQKQEQEQKRQSNEGKEIKREMPPSLQEYLRKKEQEQELLRTLPPDLSPYYKNKVRDYFREVE